METVATQRLRHFSAAERGEWISLYRPSQLPLDQFAQQHGLKQGTLQRWLRQERQRSSPSPEASGATFQKVRLPSFFPARAWVAEILLPNGVVVCLGATATPAWIQQSFKLDPPPPPPAMCIPLTSRALHRRTCD